MRQGLRAAVLSAALMLASLAGGASSASATTLVDHYSNATNALASQDFNDNGTFDSGDIQLADDFVVPAGERGSISSMDADGEYTAQGAPAAGPVHSVDVYFYASGSSAPVGSPVASRQGVAYTDISSGAGALRLDLGTPVTLTHGTYWVSVWVHQDASTHGQWRWGTRTVQTGEAAGAFYPKPLRPRRPASGRDTP